MLLYHSLRGNLSRWCATTIDRATSRWYKVLWPGGAGPWVLKAVSAYPSGHFFGRFSERFLASSVAFTGGWATVLCPAERFDGIAWIIKPRRRLSEQQRAAAQKVPSHQGRNGSSALSDGASTGVKHYGLD